jgi:hypothetical protein
MQVRLFCPQSPTHSLGRLVAPRTNTLVSLPVVSPSHSVMNSAFIIPVTSWSPAERSRNRESISSMKIYTERISGTGPPRNRNSPSSHPNAMEGRGMNDREQGAGSPDSEIPARALTRDVDVRCLAALCAQERTTPRPACLTRQTTCSSYTTISAYHVVASGRGLD